MNTMPPLSLLTRAPPARWILLRGLMRESGHWGPFLQSFKAALPPGSEVITPDLPGNGVKWRERSPASIRGLMASVRDVLSDDATGGPWHVLAMSLGAMVATEWALQHPEEVAGCVLINTSMRPHSPFWHRLRPRQYTRIARLVLNGTALEWEDGIMRMTTQHPGPRQAMLTAWLTLRSSRPVSTGNALRQLWAAARYRAAGVPDVPVLLLNSLQDQLVNPACSARIAQAWGASLRTHPTAGHDLPLDDGAWVTCQVLDWLNGTPSRVAAASPADTVYRNG